MLQNFAEIVRNDESLLALLEIGDRASVMNGINVVDTDGIRVKILKIDSINPKNYSRRIAWTVTGLLLLNLTKFYSFHVDILFEDSRLLKANFDKQKLSFNCNQTTKRKITSKQATKRMPGGKKPRTIAGNSNEQTSFVLERFWEVPLTLESNINLTRDPSLAISFEQITLREIDFDDSVESTVDEWNDGFGDEGEGFVFEANESMGSDLAVDENMNDITVPSVNFEPMQLENGDIEPMELEGEDTIQSSSTHQENRNEETPNVLANLSPQPSSAIASVVVAPKKKSMTSKRRKILMDEEKEISNADMGKRISNAFVSCKNRANHRMRISKQFEQLRMKSNDKSLFTVPAIQGLFNQELFTFGAKTRPMPVDWTIINDAFDSNDRAAESHNASDILQGEHCGQFIRTRSQSRISLNELSFNELSQPITSTPIKSARKRPWSRQSDRSSIPPPISAASSYSNSPNICTPPTAFKNPATPNLPIRTASPPSTFKNPSNHIVSSAAVSPPSAFKNPTNKRSSNRTVSPPPAFKDSSNRNSPSLVSQPTNFDDDDGLCGFSQNNSGLANGENVPPLQHASGQKIMDSESDESEGNAIEQIDLMNTTIDKGSSEYEIISKLIRLWRKNVQPIQMENLLKKGCNRFQAAKTFAALLFLKKKDLVQLENANDGKITHISAGPNITLRG